MEPCKPGRANSRASNGEPSSGASVPTATAPGQGRMSLLLVFTPVNSLSRAADAESSPSITSTLKVSSPHITQLANYPMASRPSAGSPIS